VEIGSRVQIRPTGEPGYGYKIHSYNYNHKGFSRSSYWLFKNKFIPCCDDERCESVETSATSAPSMSCDEGILRMQCVYLGYFRQISTGGRLAALFILKIQQNIRAISNASAQPSIRLRFEILASPS
jgi:hypothetical protein